MQLSWVQEESLRKRVLGTVAASIVAEDAGDTEDASWGHLVCTKSRPEIQLGTILSTVLKFVAQRPYQAGGDPCKR